MMETLRSNRLLASLLAGFMLFVSMQSAVHAAMVSTADVVAQEQSAIDRQMLMAALDREEVQDALVAYGVDLAQAKARVASLTDDEIVSINQQIDEMPAGSGVLGTVVFVFLVLLITDILGLTDVFPFVVKPHQRR